MLHQGSFISVSATSKNLTQAQCEFQPWVDYIPGRYNLSVVITQSGPADVKTNTSLQIYYYNCTDLSVTGVVPNEVLLDDLPRYVTLEGSGFFDWEETVCYFGPQMTTDVVFVDTSRLKCKVGGLAAIGQFVCLFIQFCRGRQEEPAIILVTRAFDCYACTEHM